MLAFHEMIERAAQRAGMKVPVNLSTYDANEYPHWHVFCTLQLGSPMPTPDAHWHNAEIIAGIPDDKIRTMTYQDFVDEGFGGYYDVP